MNSTDNEVLSSVSKSLRILKAFDTQRSIWRVGELAEELNFSKSTVSRLIQTLVDEDFLTEDPNEPGYRLGSALLSLGGHYVSDSELYQEVAPVLNKLVLETGESAHIAVKNKHQVLYLNKQMGPFYSDIKTQIGALNPAHATSSGKVLLAHSPEETIDIILTGELEAYTEHTLTNPIKLKKDFEQIRHQGYSISREELVLGNYSIAAPVYNYESEIVCAITIVGPIVRLTDQKLERFTRLIVRSAQEASERLGYDG
jgi:DNA-binding IclR family transcriptional regulator